MAGEIGYKSVDNWSSIHLIVGEVNLIDVREAGSEELWNGACQAATIKIQLSQLWKDAGLIGHWPLKVLISNVQISHIAIAWQGSGICRHSTGQGLLCLSVLCRMVA